MLSQHCLDIQNIREQGYDRASNMQGMWNGLQALILNDCLYAYNIHCFAHRLQLALVKASKQIVPISGFFLKLLFLIKIVNASYKRNGQLKVANANEIARLIDLEELETGSRLNQISTLQQPVKTCWSSHFRLVSSLLRMFTSAIEVLLNIIDDAIDGEYQAKAESAYDGLTSFEFVFIFHLEEETMEIISKLFQALQSRGVVGSRGLNWCLLGWVESHELVVSESVESVMARLDSMVAGLASMVGFSGCWVGLVGGHSSGFYGVVQQLWVVGLAMWV